MSTSMLTPITTTTATPPAPAANSVAQLTSEDTFLKLLVAQIQNQDPTSPTDPTQFVGQLTQYSELEQLMQINSGISTIDAGAASATTPAGSTAAGSTAAGATSNSEANPGTSGTTPGATHPIAAGSLHTDQQDLVPDTAAKS